MRRPWRSRVWTIRPQWHWFGPKTLIPFYTGGDEYDWHTVVLGWTITGRVVIATRPCPAKSKGCRELAEEGGLTKWPIDGYGHVDPGYDLDTGKYSWRKWRKSREV